MEPGEWSLRALFFQSPGPEPTDALPRTHPGHGSEQAPTPTALLTISRTRQANRRMRVGTHPKHPNTCGSPMPWERGAKLTEMFTEQPNILKQT